MLSETIECHASTSAPPDFVDLTDQIRAAIETCAVVEGRVTVFSPDQTCAILVNERESGLLEDIKSAIARLSNGSGGKEAEPGGGDVLRSDSDILIGSSSVVLPIVDGELKLGTWQRVLLVEMGEASERTISVQIVGERA